MPKSLMLERSGGPECFAWKDTALPEPGQGEVLLKHTALGLNFIDIYHRNGAYPLPHYPGIIGMEGAGVVEKVGPGCEGIAAGDKVGYGKGPVGAYAQYRTISAGELVKLPDALAPEIAAAAMLKGLTAHFLMRRCFIVNEYHTLLIHAAAGGVGLMLCQMGKLLGARIIGTVGSEEKAELAKANGCDYPLLYKQENIVARVREITDGMGVNAVYDGVGAATLDMSLDCLMRLGILVSYGQASGNARPIDPLELMRRGSLFLTRPSLMDYMVDAETYRLCLKDVFDLLSAGLVKANVGQSFYLSDAASAHKELEAGRTLGSTLLIVN